MENTHLLELLNRTLVDTAALVDQVCVTVSLACCGRGRLGSLTSSGGRLARVDVADDHDVDMNLFFTIEC